MKSGIDKCSPEIRPSTKKNSLVSCKRIKNDVEHEDMEFIPYIVGCVLYLQACTKLDLNLVVGMLGKYQSNSGTNHWKLVAQNLFRYIQGAKGLHVHALEVW